MERNSTTVSYSTAKSSPKLRLFGVELEQFDVMSFSERDESVNSSSASSTVTEKPGRSGPDPDDKKFECQYCLKVFANSQALGGHQNAHKKERMRKKRMQMQARKASINCFIQPFDYDTCQRGRKQYSFNYYAAANPAWTVYDPSCSPESQISFGPDAVGPGWNDGVSFGGQRDGDTFSLTHVDRSRAAPTAGMMMKKGNSNSNSSSKKICGRKNLDLQLGLSLHSTI